MRFTYPSGDGMLAFIPLEILVRLLVILSELLHDVLATVAERFFDFACYLQVVLRGYSGHFTSFPHEVQYELGDIASCYGNVLDSTSDDVSVRAGDNVRYTIAGIDDRSSECAIGDSVGGPGGGKSEHGLDGDV